MTYVLLRVFEDMIGQDALVKTLTNAFKPGRVAHAFMLTGVRGPPGVDTAARAELIPRVAQRRRANPGIHELDLNPVFAFQSGVKTADVRVLL